MQYFMTNHGISIYYILLSVAFLLVTPLLHAQHTNDDFKRNLRKSLQAPEAPNIKSELKYQPFQVQQNNTEILEVSPTTKLPTRYDKVELHELIPPIEKLQIDLNVTNVDNRSQLGRSAIDYSDGKVHAIPDARSISQSVQHTRNDYGLGFYADDSSAEWLIKLRNRTSRVHRDIDLDPVRFFQRKKAEKHRKQVEKIKKVYNQE